MVLSNQDLSESIQMYLISIYRLRDGEEPVPIPALVEEMGLTPASINEMCRKLEKEKLLVYLPYAGVKLTEQGEDLAREVLRKHRLWEVFLVGRLGFDFDQAHDIACRLEHYTEDGLADRLELYLEQPQVNPRGEPIPRSRAAKDNINEIPLLLLTPGTEAKITHLGGDKVEMGYLLKHELKPGEPVLVEAMDDSSLLILTQGEHLILSRELAEKVFVQPFAEKQV
jgi:DtxR family Mn-dependent transcriptional regulator